MRKKLMTVLVVILAVAAFLPLSNLLGLAGRNEPIETVGGVPEYAPVSTILQGKCVDCHSSSLTRTPIYARLPVARSMIDEDRKRGERRWMVSREQYAGEVEFAPLALARLEGVLREGSMPPAAYKLMHWTAGLSEEERQDIAGWIRAERAGGEAAADIAENLKGEPVQPLPSEVALDVAKVELGDRLFHDGRLSGDGTLSCASCHGLDKGGTDQRRVSVGIRGQEGPINSPTVFNASYNLAQFWDGRAQDLQEQAAGPVANPIEMGAEWDAVVEVLKQDPSYRQAFSSFYDDGITRENVTDAIATFEESLVTANAPFDRYLGGQEDAIPADALRGYELFKSTGCTDCHFGPALGGASFEKMGVKADYFADWGGAITEVDHGRFNVTREEEDRHFFKVPVLRNVAVTYPYFHDGSAGELGETVETMAWVQRGRRLSEEEAGLVVAFLGSLTGEYRGHPLDEPPPPPPQP